MDPMMDPIETGSAPSPSLTLPTPSVTDSLRKASFWDLSTTASATVLVPTFGNLVLCEVWDGERAG